MKKRKIGVDFDDVLVECFEGFCAYHNDTYGTSLAKKDIVRHEVEDLLGCSKEEAAQRFYNFFGSEHHIGIQPLEGAVRSVGLLKAESSLTIITARPEGVRNATMELLEKHFSASFEEIYFLEHFHNTHLIKKTKGELCRKLGIEIFLEDAPRNAVSAGEEGIHVLLFDTPWNQGVSHSNITRVFGWDDALTKLLAL